MKDAIRNLLNDFIDHEPDAATEATIAYFEDALDAGVFDCLSGHSGNHPPNDTRDVLCYDCEGFHLGFYAHDLKWWYFHIPGEKSEPCYEIYQWWELPKRTK